MSHCRSETDSNRWGLRRTGIVTGSYNYFLTQDHQGNKEVRVKIESILKALMTWTYVFEITHRIIGKVIHHALSDVCSNANGSRATKRERGKFTPAFDLSWWLNMSRQEVILGMTRPGFSEVAYSMNRTEILCPYCKNSHLREIKLPPRSLDSIGGDGVKIEGIKLFYICLSCTKMMNEEELNIWLFFSIFFKTQRLKLWIKLWFIWIIFFSTNYSIHSRPFGGWWANHLREAPWT